MIKNYILTTLILLVSLYLNAQTVQTTLMVNDPVEAYTQFIAPELTVDIADTDDNLKLDVLLGVNGRKHLTDKIDLEGLARFGLFGFNVRTTYQLEAGIFMPFQSNTKTKEINVITSVKAFAGTDVDGNTYDEVSMLTFDDGKFLNQLGLHAGVYSKAYKFTFGDDINVPETDVKVNNTGIYVGLQRTSQAFYKILMSGNEIRHAASFTRFYADLLFLPINTIDLDGAEKDSPIGGRLGMQWYVNAHDGDFKGMWGRSVFSAEVGLRPYENFYVSLTWGMAFKGKSRL